MALRIGGGLEQSEAMSDPAMMMPEEEMPIEEPMVEPQQDMMSAGMVSPEAARYMRGDARCMNCVHFMEPGNCEIVSGKIEPDGVCMLFTGDVEEASEEMMESEEAVIPEV